MIQDRAAVPLLAELAGDGPVLSRTMIVVAHPDDETIAIGAQLCRFGDALLLHVTDGAPRDGADTRAHGFSTLADYAAARRRELAAALEAGEAHGVRTAMFGVPDKDAFLDLVGLSRRLVPWLRREQPEAVVTHAYEGGHPDHDAAAFAVHAACRLISAEQRISIVESPISHAEGGAMVTGHFLSDDRDELVVLLRDAACRRKRRMLDCFVTQRQTLACFAAPGPERFRLAPAYDFRAPPHPGTLLYETYDWGIGGDDWRRRAASAFVALGLD